MDSLSAAESKRAKLQKAFIKLHIGKQLYETEWSLKSLSKIGLLGRNEGNLWVHIRC